MTDIKGLRLYLPPFAPDTSGAASVLYPLGGLVVIVDAGGCAGNICGFDEPRTDLPAPSVMASAGLRDMDAIMGRDDRLLAKVKKALQQDAGTASPPFSFLTLVGTPVPAVIGTDLTALAHLAEKQTGLPCIAVASNGIHAYDRGASTALFALVQKFTRPCQTVPGKLGVLGVTPLDFTLSEQNTLRESLLTCGWEQVSLLGADGLASLREAAGCERLLVVSPSGLAAAEYLQEKLGPTYDTVFPQELTFPLWTAIKQQLPPGSKRLLIIQQQFAANALRDFLRTCLPEGEIICGTCFELVPKLAEAGDFTFHEETEFQTAAQSFDTIIGDSLLRRALPGFNGAWIDYPHFAISGKTY